MNRWSPILCSSIALRDRPLKEAACTIAEAGFAGIEILHPHIAGMSLAELEEIGAYCHKLGLGIGVISPYFVFTRSIGRTKESLKAAEEVLQQAKVLGVTRIRTFVDCGPDGLTSEEATEADWSAACKGLRELCALSPSTLFVVETHDWTLADTLPSTQRLIREVAQPNLKLNYQPTHDFMRRGFLDCFRDLFPCIAHMHWKQVRADGSETYLEEPGEIDFSALVELMRTMDYSGTASVEYCWSPIESGRLTSAARFLDQVAPDFLHASRS